MKASNIQVNRKHVEVNICFFMVDPIIPLYGTCLDRNKIFFLLNQYGLFKFTCYKYKITATVT